MDFLIGMVKKNISSKKTRVLGVYSNFYSSTSTTPRNMTQVSFERKNRVLEHQEYFSSLFFVILRFFEIKKKVNFHFFNIIKIVILDIIQKSKKTVLGVVEHTFTFRMIPVL